MKGSTRLNAEGLYEIARPFRDELIYITNNKEQIYSSFISPKQRLLTDRCLFEDYCKYMKLMEYNGFIEKVPDGELNVKSGLSWYLNHHGVYHKQNRKRRVLFNCLFKFKSVSLNDKLLQWPDLTNSLLGVLLRFRNDIFAFTADLEKMFYQIKVPTDYANFMGFFFVSKL